MVKVNFKLVTMLAILSALMASTIAFIPSASADPIVITVNSLGDSSDAIDEGAGFYSCETSTPGECTLRAAIETANANTGADTIEFEIPGSGVQTITIGSDLPAITETLAIDGYSQTGAVANSAVSPNPFNGTLLIHIDTAAAPTGAFSINAPGASIKGLAINRCAIACVLVDTNNVEIKGNYIGTDATGLSMGISDTVGGVYISENSSNAEVGGINPEDRNVIANIAPNNQHAGIMLSGDHSTIYGNYIGIGKDGVTDLTPDAADANGLLGELAFGINILQGGGDSNIGGPSTSMRNVISGNTANVIFSNGPSNGNNLLQGNYIGPDYTGEVNPNITNGIGVSASFAQDNLIGGDGPGEGNVIAGVLGSGISVASIDALNVFAFDPTHISILGNSIYDVGVFEFDGIGDTNQGIDNAKFFTDQNFNPIDFELRGPTANDAGDLDAGANNYMNFPVLKTAVQTGQNVDIAYDLDVAGSDSDQYRVEFFANDRSSIFGYGPGQTFIGSDITSNGSGKTVTLNVGAADYVNKALSATVTAINSTTPTGFGDTSEFAQNISIGSATDVDSDGISDVVEDAAPNGGDGNDDSIADKLQPTVTSYEISNTDTYTTFVTNGCSENGTVSSVTESNLVATDSGYTYPYGLTDFTLNCERGKTVDITKYVFTDDSATDTQVRKYRASAIQHFIEVPDSTVTSETIGSEQALVLEYSITDGDPTLDDDGQANGIIVDPVGIARVYTSSTTTDNSSQGNANGQSNSAKGTLAKTGGQELNLQVLFGTLFFSLGLALLFSIKVPKKVRVKI